MMVLAYEKVTTFSDLSSPYVLQATIFRNIFVSSAVNSTAFQLNINESLIDNYSLFNFQI